MELEEQIEIACTPGDLFPWIATQTGQLKWISGLITAEATAGDPSDMPAVGHGFKQRLEHGPVKLDLEGVVTAISIPASFAFDASANDVSFSVEITLQASGAGTLLRQRTKVELHSFVLKLMATKIRTELETKAKDDLARLKELAGT